MQSSDLRFTALECSWRRQSYVLRIRPQAGFCVELRRFRSCRICVDAQRSPTLTHSHLLAEAQVSGISGIWPKVGAFHSVVLQLTCLLDVGRHLDELHIGTRRTTDLELLHPVFYGLQEGARRIQIFLFTREC